MWEEVDMFYVGVSHYFATGEGVTIYVASGHEASIRASIPEYFHPGLTILTPAEWIKASTESTGDDYIYVIANMLKSHLPMLWTQLEERASERGFHIDIFMKHHFNYG